MVTIVPKMSATKREDHNPNKLLRYLVPLAIVLLLGIATTFILFNNDSSNHSIDISSTASKLPMSGVFGVENNGETTYRWTRALAEFIFKNVTLKPYRVHLQIHAGPPEAPARWVTVSVNNQDVGYFLAERTWTDYYFDYSPTEADQQYLQDGIMSVRTNVDTFLEGGSKRELGIMISAVSLDSQTGGGPSFPPLYYFGTVLPFILGAYFATRGVRPFAIPSLVVSILLAIVAVGYLLVNTDNFFVIWSIGPPYLLLLLGIAIVISLVSMLPEKFILSYPGALSLLIISILLYLGLYFALQGLTLNTPNWDLRHIFSDTLGWVPIVFALPTAALLGLVLLGLKRGSCLFLRLQVGSYFLALLFPIYSKLMSSSPDWQRILTFKYPTTVLGILFVGLVTLQFLLIIVFLKVNYSSFSQSITKQKVALLAAFLPFFFGLTIWQQVSFTLTGDEPYYLIATHSIVYDHDLILNNNFDNQDYLAFYKSELKPTWVGGDKVILPRQDLGLSMALVPGYFLGGKFGAMLEMTGLAIVLVISLFALFTESGLSPSVSFFTALILGASSPLMVYSSQLFPEVVGAVLASFFIRFAVLPKTLKRKQIIFSVISLGLMPWFHARYWLLVGVFALFLFFRLVSNFKRLAIASVFFIAFVGAFVLLGQSIYNVALPNANVFARGNFSGFFDWTRFLNPFFGVTLDRAAGLIPNAPVFLVFPVGMFYLLKRRNKGWYVIVTVFLVYYLVNALRGIWWGGWSPPARYMVPILPILGLFLANAFERARGWFKVSSIVLAVASFAISFAFMAIPVLRYFDYDSMNTMSSLSRFLTDAFQIDPFRAFPTFFAHDYGADIESIGLVGLWAAIILIAIPFSHLRRIQPDYAPAETTVQNVEAESGRVF